MADISRVTIPSGATYDIKDIVARQQLPWATISNTSTSTNIIITAPGITSLASGVYCTVYNNVIASASGCTVNVNGLGAKPIYLSQGNNIRVTTQFTLNTTWILVYNSTRVTNGCWDLICFSGDAAFITFDIDTSDGNLYMYKPDPDTLVEDVDFSVNTSNGNLEVTFSY